MLSDHVCSAVSLSPQERCIVHFFKGHSCVAGSWKTRRKIRIVQLCLSMVGFKPVAIPWHTLATRVQSEGSASATTLQSLLTNNQNEQSFDRKPSFQNYSCFWSEILPTQKILAFQKLLCLPLLLHVFPDLNQTFIDLPFVQETSLWSATGGWRSRSQGMLCNLIGGHSR